MPKKEKWINHPWTITIGSVLLTSMIGTAIYDSFKDFPILASLWNAIKWVGSSIWWIFNIRIQLWIIIIFLILYKIIKYTLLKESPSQGNTYDFTNYTEDQIKRWKWSWNWELMGNKYHISQLKVHCPECDTPMLHIQNFNGSIIGYKCPRCEYESKGIPCDDPAIAERLILDNIDRKQKGK